MRTVVATCRTDHFTPEETQRLWKTTALTRDPRANRWAAHGSRRTGSAPTGGDHPVEVIVARDTRSPDDARLFVVGECQTTAATLVSGIPSSRDLPRVAQAAFLATTIPSSSHPPSNAQFTLETAAPSRTSRRLAPDHPAESADPPKIRNLLPIRLWAVRSLPPQPL